MLDSMGPSSPLLSVSHSGRKVRTLLIDNYDSYTFNVFQWLACVNGVPPTVIRNDQFTWEQLARDYLPHFDNIVISPGPGHPANEEDFGVCRAVLACAQIPVLGVCLGHQGLALQYGSTVGHAPLVMHGRLSPVTHTETPLVICSDGLEASEENILTQQCVRMPLLFADIPSPFRVVRYHSLAVVGEIPSCLEAFAWSDDGVVMAMRHSTRPQWGVQFHPESICTEYGKKILSNFYQITCAFMEAQPLLAPHSPTASMENISVLPNHLRHLTMIQPMQSLSRQTSRASSPDASQAYDVHVARVEGVHGLSTEHAFVELYGDSIGAFWLDSSRVEKGLSRFSFMGCANGPRGEMVSYDVSSKMVTCRGARGTSRTQLGGEDSFFEWLQDRVDERKPRRLLCAHSGTELSPTTLPFSFHCGYVGYFGYEMRAESGIAGCMTSDQQEAQQQHLKRNLFPNKAKECNKESAKCMECNGGCTKERTEGERYRCGLPTCSFLFADRVVVFDHETGDVHLLCFTAQGTEHDREWMQATTEALQRYARAPREEMERRVEGIRTGRKEVGRTDAGPTVVRLREPKEAYVSNIAESLRCIDLGETYEVCLTTQLAIPNVAPDPLALHLNLRRRNPAPYAVYMRLGDCQAVVGSSPEKFLTIDADGHVESKPIKGTRPRGQTPEEDRRLADDLRSDEKDFAENLMIVDLIRNDLGEVCKPSSVVVPKLMNVETYATVHQLVSTVTGDLRDDMTALDCIRACFPPGSMTGAPKHRTTQIIDCLEQGPRGVYSGTMGYLSLSGAADMNVIIRTVMISENGLCIGAGGAIVALSDVEAEYEEMLLKARAPIASILETLGRSPKWTTNC
eukprot:comp23345_c0_seq1/m.38513 comp23345_c0_seq1/g.38513  ORF comp23345_c0_seq1/g.38513 comp23345_c0_seq1/m.38513 type:complete len:854 (-) comp23345_c0_seq1:663-3224(-)